MRGLALLALVAALTLPATHADARGGRVVVGTSGGRDGQPLVKVKRWYRKNDSLAREETKVYGVAMKKFRNAHSAVAVNTGVAKHTVKVFDHPDGARTTIRERDPKTGARLRNYLGFREGDVYLSIEVRRSPSGEIFRTASADTLNGRYFVALKKVGKAIEVVNVSKLGSFGSQAELDAFIAKAKEHATRSWPKLEL